MNLKRTLLSLAVAGVAAAPIMASAADGSMYGNIRYGFTQTDDGSANKENILKNMGSRIGMKGDTDLGNGMTGFGHYEVHMVNGGLRELKVGVKGDFGQVYMGDKTNHTWDSMMTTDNSWWWGGQEHITEGVQSNAITYMGGSGPVSFGITAAMSAQETNAADESVDQMEIGLGFDAGLAQIAIAMTDEKKTTSDPEATVGVVVKTTAGPLGVAFDYQTQDGTTTNVVGDVNADLTSMQLEITMDSFLFQYGQQESTASVVEGSASASKNPSTMVLSYTQNLGPDTLIYYEYANRDFDTSADDESRVTAVLKYNIM